MAPLNIPPSRARRTLAARLAQKNQNAPDSGDPDAADAVAVETASMLPEEPSEIDHAPGAADSNVDGAGLQITGMRTLGGGAARNAGSKFSGLFSSSDSSEEGGDSDNDDESLDEDEAGRDETLFREGGEYEDHDTSASSSSSSSSARRRDRRPSTTEAKERTLLDDDDDDEALELPSRIEKKLVLGSTEAPYSDPPAIKIEDDEDVSSEDELVEIARPRRTS